MSHHSLGAFFSGTDISTLQKEGNDTNCFLSLIVDTPGNYVAAITRKVQSKEEITVKDLGSSYAFFGKGDTVETKNRISKHTTEKTVIQYFMLEVERHPVENPLFELDQRFQQIEEQKRQNARKSWGLFDRISDSVKELPNYSPVTVYSPTTGPAPVSQTVRQQSLFKEEPVIWNAKSVASNKDYTPDPGLVHDCVCRMVACSLFLNIDKFNLESWINKHMEYLYTTRFFTQDQVDEYIDFITESMVCHFKDLSAPVYLTDDEFRSIVASAFIKELTPFESNRYIAKFIDSLSIFIL